MHVELYSHLLSNKSSVLGLFLIDDEIERLSKV